MVKERQKGDPFPTTETKHILKDIRIVLPDIHPTILDFGRYLGAHLPSYITAEEFVSDALELIKNFEKGLNTSGKTRNHVLLEQDQVVVNLRKELPRIITAIFPKKFGAEVNEALKKYHDE